jgi:hypothetical protein
MKNMIVNTEPIVNIFPSYTGTLLLAFEEKLVLYDIHQGKSIAEVPTSHIKFVIWSQKEKDSLLALLCRDSTTSSLSLRHLHVFLFVSITHLKTFDLFLF